MSNLLLPVCCRKMPTRLTLIQELIKNTWWDHPDLGNLKLALEQIREAATIINRAKKFQRSKERIEALNSKSKFKYNMKV